MALQRLSNDARGPAGSARANSPLRYPALRAVQLRSDFARVRSFSLALRFPLRGNEKLLTRPGVPPGRVAPLFWRRNIVFFFPIAFGFSARSEPPLFRDRNAILFVRRLILRFSPSMIRTDRTVSKLCAWDTRHAPDGRPSAARRRSTWQGGGHPLRCILPLCRHGRHADTVPVSAPSAARRAFAALALVSWRLRP